MLIQAEVTARLAQIGSEVVRAGAHLLPRGLHALRVVQGGLPAPLRVRAARLGTGLLRHPRVTGGVLAAGVAGAGALWYWNTRPLIAPEVLEAQRREHLTEQGRSIVGTILDATPNEREATQILYQYRVAGVTYERGQDVSALGEHLQDLKVDMPVQVRYDPHNPGDSMVVSEHWNGLWHGEGYAPPQRMQWRG